MNQITHQGSLPSLPNQVELIDDKAHPNDLVFMRNEKKAVMSEMDIEKLLHMNQGKKASDLQKIGRSGLQSSADVIAFLKTPEGPKARRTHEELIAVMNDTQKLAQDSAVKEHLSKFIKALLHFLDMAEKKDLSKYYAAIQKQIDKNLAYIKKYNYEHSHAKSNAANSFDPNARLQLLESYAAATRLSEEHLQAKQQEAEEIRAELAACAAELEEIEVRYATLIDNEQMLFEHTDSLEAMAEQEGNTDEAVFSADQRLQILLHSLGILELDVRAFVTDGQDNKAEPLINEMDGLNLQIEGLQVIKQAFKSEKTLYDAEGQRTNSYRKAAYTIDSGLQLVKDKETGKFYLLSAGKDFNELSQEEKAQAEQNFEASKDSIILNNIKIGQNKASEVTYCEGRRNMLNARHTLVLGEISAAQVQCNAARDRERVAIAENPLPTSPSLKPEKKATPNPLATSPSPKQARALSYSQMLGRIPTQDSINRFKNTLVHPNGRPNTAAQQAVENTIRPGEVILPRKMQMLLATMARLGIDPNKPNVTSIQNQHPQSAQKKKIAAEAENKESPSSTPTPLKTTPSPYNNK